MTTCHISFIAVRQGGNPIIGIDNISMRRQSGLPSTSISPASHTSTANTTFHTDHNLSHHTSIFPTSEAIKTPSSSREILVTPAESNINHQRSSGGVQSSISTTSVSVTPSTDFPPASHTSTANTAFNQDHTLSHHTNTIPAHEAITTPSTSRKLPVTQAESNTDHQRSSDCPSLASVAMVSTVVVIAVVAMVAVVAVLFYRRRMGEKSLNPNTSKRLDFSVHGDPTFSTAELHKEGGLGGDVYVSQDVILKRKAAQSNLLIDAHACGAANDVACGTIDSGNVMPLHKMTKDNKKAAVLYSENEYCSLVRGLNTRSKQHSQRKVGTNQGGKGPTDTGDEYQTLAQTDKPDVKTHTKTSGSDEISKTVRNHDNEDGSATEHTLYQNLRAELQDKPPVEDLFDDDDYGVPYSDNTIGNAYHHNGEPCHHGDGESSHVDTSVYYSVVMSDISGLGNSSPTRREPLYSSDVYEELA